ncbi:hypothetical protein NY2A_b627L [Paramecium bursaria Chlorella virus NY2A]|uniref:Uncharacterized protein b627L n=1 Tax=Paramecium bursaria Chlorella virus NY2A TaxID=46021 RepID=A7IXF2_PBCVN|nr:hypothetical protein NY2A_b627L [Paramecium bursaria Chlorella virus NY2A]ABT15026.1 hypothetical protein NY2A_b627L [Paramecium bursaria Chlorella virus NY2A]
MISSVCLHRKSKMIWQSNKQNFSLWFRAKTFKSMSNTKKHSQKNGEFRWHWLVTKYQDGPITEEVSNVV